MTFMMTANTRRHEHAIQQHQTPLNIPFPFSARHNGALGSFDNFGNLGVGSFVLGSLTFGSFTFGSFTFGNLIFGRERSSPEDQFLG